MGNVCQATAIILFIADFIGSIVLGNELGGYSFNWAVFLYVVIAGFLFCLLLYAVGEIINQLKISNSNTYELYQLIKKNNPKGDNKTESPKSYFTSSAQTVRKAVDGGWFCKNCGTKNETNSLSCKDCGTYK